MSSKERIRTGIVGGLYLGGAIGCVVVMIVGGRWPAGSWEVILLFGAGAILLLARAIAYLGASIRGRRGGWVDELAEIVRGRN